jgi:hypothetical protein
MFFKRIQQKKSHISKPNIPKTFPNDTYDKVKNHVLPRISDFITLNYFFKKIIVHLYHNTIFYNSVIMKLFLHKQNIRTRYGGINSLFTVM